MVCSEQVYILQDYSDYPNLGKFKSKCGLVRFLEFFDPFEMRMFKRNTVLSKEVNSKVNLTIVLPDNKAQELKISKLKKSSYQCSKIKD